VIWVANSLSPQEIRERIMSRDSRFTRRLIRYLEDCHRSEFFGGTQAEASATVKSASNGEPASTYLNPTLTLPIAPPVLCSSNQCVEPCRGCHKRREWWTYYIQEVDDLLVRSNIHEHYLSVTDEAAKALKK
ncbi:hypothetical protein C8R44DRAFT_598607, partial [Mycena epipterygia]